MLGLSVKVKNIPNFVLRRKIRLIHRKSIYLSKTDSIACSPVEYLAGRALNSPAGGLVEPKILIEEKKGKHVEIQDLSMSVCLYANRAKNSFKPKVSAPTAP